MRQQGEMTSVAGWCFDDRPADIPLAPCARNAHRCKTGCRGDARPRSEANRSQPVSSVDCADLIPIIAGVPKLESVAPILHRIPAEAFTLIQVPPSLEQR